MGNFHNYDRNIYRWQSLFLTNSIRILDLTMGDVSELNLFQNNKTIERNYCRTDFGSVWGPFLR